MHDGIWTIEEYNMSFLAYRSQLSLFPSLIPQIPTLNASFATFEPCECMQVVTYTRRVAVAVFGPSHRHG